MSSERDLSLEELEHLQSKTKYSAEQLEELFQGNDFKSKKEGLTKQEFEQYLQRVYSLDPEKDTVLLHRLFQLFDRDSNNFIDFDEFATGLAVLTNHAPHQKLHFIFNAFDLNGDGKISREEFTSIVQSLWENPLCSKLFDFAIDEKKIEGLEVFVTGFFKEADTNKDGYISFDEYKAISKKYTKDKADHKLKILAYQTGGHIGTFAKVDAGKIKKAVSDLELQFYEGILSEFPDLQPFVPTFYGAEKSDGKNWVIMQDLTSAFKRPCVMDIKMGLTSAGEDANPKKKQEMEAKDKESTTITLGLRITGMKVYRTDKNDFVQFTKSWGRKVTDDNIVESLTQYFNNGMKIRRDIIPLFLGRLNSVQKWVECQSKMRFYSSSLLFVYEGDPDEIPNADIKMIDFAHVFPIREQHGKDEGYIRGVTNLVTYLDKINRPL